MLCYAMLCYATYLGSTFEQYPSISRHTPNVTRYFMPEAVTKLKTASAKPSPSKASNRSDAPSSNRSSKSSGKKKTKPKGKKSDLSLNAVAEENVTSPLGEELAATFRPEAPVFGTLAWAGVVIAKAPVQEAVEVDTITAPVYGTLAWAEAKS